jgi:predicted ArsR family transcriptional regulator
MQALSWAKDKTVDTRQRIIRLLRRGRRTVEELANQLGITRNAFRSQINLLMREGIVEPQGTVPSGRRPATEYGIRAGASPQFSKAYPLVLAQLVQVLAGKLSRAEFSETMQQLGLRLAGMGPQPAGAIEERLRNAIAFLESLGSMVDVIEEKKKIIIKSYGCPISGAVNADGRLCVAMAVMIGKLVGLPATERCDRGGQPGCRFEIKLP